MKKIFTLPFDENPESCCYPYICFPHAIICAQTSTDEYNKWLCGKYINCYYKDKSNGHKFIISVYDNWSGGKKIMIYQCINFSKEIMKKMKVNIPLTIKKLLLNGIYPYGKCRESYIVRSDPSDTGLTDYIITGYNDIKKVFIIRLFDKNKELIKREVYYEEYVSALYDNANRNIQIHAWKYNDRAEYSLNFSEIINDLEDYIHSRNSKPQYPDNRTFGLQAIEDLKNYFLLQSETGANIDERYLRGYYEHKYFMEQRIKYLCSLNILPSELLECAENVSLMAQQVMNEGKNYNVSQDGAAAKELLRLTAESIEIERNYLPEVSASLQWQVK